MLQEQKQHFRDLLPDDHDYLTYVKKVLRHRCRQAGFRRVSTSLVEDYESCKKALGLEDEEMEKRAAVIRAADGTALGVIRFDPVLSIARSYVDNAMKDLPQPVELFSVDSYLQKDEQGTLVDDVHFGIHVMGNQDAAMTAQVIYIGLRILEDLGLKELYTVQINHIGSLESRKIYLEDLKNFYFDKKRSLCERCVRFQERGEFLQLLRCEEEDCSILAQLAPRLENYLTQEDREQYRHLKDYLEELEITFQENKRLSGAGNYNAYTVFEFWHNDKGSKNMVITGGGNDLIIEQFGGGKVNIFGFSCDTKILVQAMKDVGIRVPHKDHLQVFVAQLGVKAKKKGLSLLQRLRENGIQAVGAMGTGSMRRQLDMATDFKVKYTLLMGEVEVNEGMVIVRDMKAGTQESVPYDHVIDVMQERIGKEKMDVMEEGEKSVDLK